MRVGRGLLNMKSNLNEASFHSTPASVFGCHVQWQKKKLLDINQSFHRERKKGRNFLPKSTQGHPAQYQVLRHVLPKNSSKFPHVWENWSRLAFQEKVTGAHTRSNNRATHSKNGTSSCTFRLAFAPLCCLLNFTDKLCRFTLPTGKSQQWARVREALLE